MRADIQKADSDVGVKSVDTHVDRAAALSMAWDVTGDGKTLLSAGYGRYYEFIAQSLVDSIFSRQSRRRARPTSSRGTGTSSQFDYPMRTFATSSR